MQVKKQQSKLDMEQWTGSKLGKEYVKAIYFTLLMWPLHAEFIMWNAGLDEAQAGIKISGRFKREGMYVYLWLILVEVCKKTTKFCKAIILQLKTKQKEISTISDMQMILP